MSDLPRSITINEEGPREGFQIEKGPLHDATSNRQRTAMVYRCRCRTHWRFVPPMTGAFG